MGEAWPQPNQHGVYVPTQCEVLELAARDAAPTKHQQRLLTPSAEILLVQAGPQRWYAAAGYSLHSGDMRSCGAYPHDEDEQRFPDREAALEAMAEYLLERMNCVFVESEKERKGPPPPRGETHSIALTEVVEAEQVARWAARLLDIEAPEQLALALEAGDG